MSQEKVRKLPKQERSRVLVTAILDATARILASNGYAGMNTNAVAQQAGVSVGSLYQYFADKDALVAAVVERHGQRMHEAIARAVGPLPPASLGEAVERIVAAVVTAHRIDPQLHAELESEMPHVDVFDGHAGTVRAIREHLVSLPASVRSAIAIADLDKAAHVVGEMVHALVHAAVIPPTSTALSRIDIQRELTRAVMAYLTAPPSADHPTDHGHHH